MMLKRLLVLIALVALAACATQTKESAAERAVPEPSLEKIADGVWIHKSYAWVEPWGPILSQGMVVKGGGGIFLVDTAWNDADTERLLDLIKAEIGQMPIAAVVTHAHQDKMGGMRAFTYAHLMKRLSFAHPLTNIDAPKRGLAPATNTFVFEDGDREQLTSEYTEGATVLSTTTIDIFYPGPGHTRDNIVVYYAPAKVLFGGCLIRPGGATTLGNTADADIANWANAVRMVAKEFPDAEIVIPSHGPMGGRELLDHTIALAEAATNE